MKYRAIRKIFGTTGDQQNLTEQDSFLDSLKLSISSWGTFPIALSHFQLIAEPTLHYKNMSETKIPLHPWGSQTSPCKFISPCDYYGNLCSSIKENQKTSPKD
jgi:hypothetical protein